MFQRQDLGEHFWNEIPPEKVVEQLTEQYQYPPGEAERQFGQLMKGDIIHVAYGYLRLWTDGRMGNPAL